MSIMEREPVHISKSILFKHIPFFKEMIGMYEDTRFDAEAVIFKKLLRAIQSARRLTREEIIKIDDMCIDLKRCVVANRARISPPNSSQEAGNNESNSVEDQNNNNNENEPQTSKKDECEPELLEEVVEEKPIVVPQNDLREASVERINSDSDESPKEPVAAPRKRKAKKLKSTSEESESDEVPEVKPVIKRIRIIPPKSSSSDDSEKSQTISNKSEKNQSDVIQRRYSRSSRKSNASDSQIPKQKISVNTEILNTAQILATQAGVEVKINRDIKNLCDNINNNPHESPFGIGEKRNRKKVNYNENTKIVEDIEDYADESNFDKVEGKRSRKKVNYNEETKIIEETETEEEVASTPSSSSTSTKKTSDIESSGSTSVETENSTESSDDDSDREDSPIRQYRLEDFDFDLNIVKLPTNITSRARVVNGKIIPLERHNSTETKQEDNVANPLMQMTEFKYSPIRSSLLKDSEQRVSNISFTKCTSGYMYKCHYDSCTNYTIHKEVFQIHLSAYKHVDSKWNGFCKICNKTVSTESDLQSEFAHMIIHIEGPSTQRKQTARKSTKKLNFEPNASNMDINDRQSKNVLPSVSKNVDLNKTFIIQEEEKDNEDDNPNQEEVSIEISTNFSTSKTTNISKKQTSDSNEGENTKNSKETKIINIPDSIETITSEDSSNTQSTTEERSAENSKINEVIDIPDSIETITSEESLDTQPTTEEKSAENSKRIEVIDIPDSIETISSEENSNTQSRNNEVIVIPDSIENVEEKQEETMEQKPEASTTNPTIQIINNLEEVARTKNETPIEIFDTLDETVIMEKPDNTEEIKTNDDSNTKNIINSNKHEDGSFIPQRITLRRLSGDKLSTRNSIDERQQNSNNDLLQTALEQSDINLQKEEEQSKNTPQQKLVYVVKPISTAPAPIPTIITTTQVQNVLLQIPSQPAALLPTIVQPTLPVLILPNTPQPTTSKVLYSAPRVSLPFNPPTTTHSTGVSIISANQQVQSIIQPLQNIVNYNQTLSSNSIVISAQPTLLPSTSGTQIQTNIQTQNLMPQGNAASSSSQLIQKPPQKVNPQMRKLSSLQNRRQSVAFERPPSEPKRQVNLPPRRASTSTSEPRNVFPPNQSNLLMQSGTPANSNLELLRPWLNDAKTKTDREWMFTEEALKSLFKCMRPNCNFHTDDYLSFFKHVASEKERKECPYCLYETEGCPEIVKHISEAHGSTNLACGHCLYRACSRWHLEHHLTKYHKDFSKAIIACKAQQRLNHKEDLKDVKANQRKFILPIICCVCNEKFYNLNNFEQHRQTKHATSNVLSRCNKCRKNIRLHELKWHLQNCHNIKEFHCVRCSYGTDENDEMLNHLVNSHPDLTPYYCRRNGSLRNLHPNSSIDSTNIIMLHQTIVGDKHETLHTEVNFP